MIVSLILPLIIASTSLLLETHALGRTSPPLEDCRHPTGLPSSCVPLGQCPLLFNMIRRNIRGSQARRALQNLACSHNDSSVSSATLGPIDLNTAYVCCRKEYLRTTTTPHPRPPPTTPTSPTTTTSRSYQGFPDWLAKHPSRRLLPGDVECEALGQLVFKGSVSKPHGHPWIVRLGEGLPPNRKFDCAGSLISKRYILTAAHCFAEDDGNDTIGTVRLGEHDASSEEDCYDGVCTRVQDVAIDRVIVHPNYTFTKNEIRNDIALIRLAQDVKFSRTARPICLSPHSAESLRNRQAWIAGWGRTVSTSNQSRVLMEAAVDITNFNDCTTLYRTETTLFGGLDGETQLCATGRLGQDACRGDSGGPLEFLGLESVWTLVGVVSLGVNCGHHVHIPGVYTAVSPYIQWILDNMEP